MRVALSTVATINPRRPQIDLNDTDIVTFLPMEAVDDVTGTITTRTQRTFAQVKKGYTVFAENDVLFAKITPCMQNGKHAIASDLLHGIGFGSTEFHVIRHGPNLIPEWAHYFMRRQETLDAAVKTFTGTVGQQRVPPSFLESLEIPVPSIDEQRRITDCIKVQLAAVEIARKAARAQLSEVRRLKTQALHQIFSNVKATSAIGEVARVQSGYAFKSLTFQKHGVRLLRNANVSPGRVYWDDAVFLLPNEAASFGSYELREGDVLISLDRPIISSGIKVARVTAVDLPALLVQRVGRFQIDETRLSPDYLYAYLQTHAFIEAITGHEQSLGVPHISPGQIEKIEIPLPDIDEQKHLAKILIDIASYTRTAQVAAEQQLRDIELLPSRLLAQAFDKLNLQAAEHG